MRVEDSILVVTKEYKALPGHTPKLLALKEIDVDGLLGKLSEGDIVFDLANCEKTIEYLCLGETRESTVPLGTIFTCDSLEIVNLMLNYDVPRGAQAALSLGVKIGDYYWEAIGDGCGISQVGCQEGILAKFTYSGPREKGTLLDGARGIIAEFFGGHISTLSVEDVIGFEKRKLGL